MRRGTVTSLPLHSNSNLSDSCEKWTFTDSDVAFIKLRYVVETIYFINTLKAVLFDHLMGAAEQFFSWLQE